MILVRKLSQRLLGKGLGSASRISLLNQQNDMFFRNKINKGFCSDKPPEDKPSNKKVLQTFPLSNYKVENLSERDQQKSQTEYIIFSSKMPITPFSKINGEFSLGNLKTENMDKDIAYFLQKNSNEVYQIGIILDKSVQEQLKKQNIEKLSFQKDEKLEIKTVMDNYRVKIVEILQTEQGIFVKAIPYRDRKLTKLEKMVSIQNEMVRITSLAKYIKNTANYENIQIFDDIDLNTYNFNDFLIKQIDQILFKIANGIQKFSVYFKNNHNIFIQELLECRTHVGRIIMVREKLEELKSVLQIVNSNFKLVDESMIRMQNAMRARGAIDYIQQNYLREQKQANNESQQSETIQGSMEKDIKKSYLDKLHLIKDAASQQKVRQQIEMFSQMQKHQSEYFKTQTWLDDVFSIPWETSTPLFWDIEYTKKILESRIYGLDKVKKRILEMVASNKIKKQMEQGKGIVILIHGPPGTGKTSIAKCIADSLKRNSRFISFAGVNDSHFIKGHKRTYVDSQPGIFVKELIKAQTNNPVFILDEIDKIQKGNMGQDSYASLLEILNPEEQSNFTDHYMDIKTDFSNCIFILTANSILQMLEPLRNRLELIKVESYIEHEKVNIAQNYLLPSIIEKMNVTQDLVKINEENIKQMIKGWCCYEGGVRELKRSLEKIYRKYIFQIMENQQEQQEQETFFNDEVSKLIQDAKTLDFTNLTEIESFDLMKKFLGPVLFDADLMARNNKKFPPGMINILSASDYIGNVLTIECIEDLTHPDKKGQITYSGNLKNILLESITIAKLNAYRYLTKAQIEELSQTNIHIHFMEASSQKDGPSGGIAICTSLISYIQKKSIPSQLAMTGELSANGEVCKIGGVQAKITAAYAINVDTFLLPYSNMSEALELPPQLLENITIYFMRDYDQIYNLLFLNNDQNLVVLRNNRFGNIIHYDSKYHQQQEFEYTA